jgi:uncharacterized protein with PQ loop repeat
VSDVARIALFLLVCSFALFFAEMQVRQAASTRWLCLALVWLVVVALCIWLAYGT